MSEILYHAAQHNALELGKRLRAAIEDIDHPQAPGLADRISTQTHDRPHLVFTGQWSSGKSTLIKALTDGGAEVVIDSDIATDEVTEYDWDGLVTLVDTPGVQSGRQEHDVLAEGAIATADLVLFVVTGELFDDAGLRYLHHVTDTLGKRDQLLVVIAQANALKAGPGVRDAEMRKAMGGLYDVVRFVECDARDYLDGLAHTDPTRAAAYRDISKIDDLRESINLISASRGDLGRYRQPLQAVLAVALEAESLLVEDPDEAAALALLARQRASVSARMQRIDAKLRDLAAVFRAESVRAAESFADDVDSIESLPEGEERQAQINDFTRALNWNLDQAAERLGTDVQNALTMQYDDFADEVREIEATPHTRLVLDLAHRANVEPPESGVHVRDLEQQVSARDGAATPSWAPSAGRWLKEFQGGWGAGSGLKASSQTFGHKVVLDTGHFFGKKFKPWEAVRVADRIGKAAKVGGAVLTVGLEVSAVIAQERSEVAIQRDRAQRRKRLINEVLQQAETISHHVVQQVRTQVEAAFSEAYAGIDSVHAEILQARRHRSSLSQEIGEIQALARTELLRLPVAAPSILLP